MNYKFGVPESGNWRCVLNTDAGVYQGANNLLEENVAAWDTAWDGYGHSLTVFIPAMSAQFYRWEG